MNSSVKSLVPIVSGGLPLPGCSELEEEPPLALLLLSSPPQPAAASTAAVYIIATTPLAALAGGGGLGDISVNQPTYHLEGVIAATIVVVVLAFAVDLLLGLVQRAVTPRGIALPKELQTIVPATETATTTV